MELYVHETTISLNFPLNQDLLSGEINVFSRSKEKKIEQLWEFGNFTIVGPNYSTTECTVQYVAPIVGSERGC